MNGDLNLNYAECLNRVINWGENTIVNICNGEIHTVPWGSIDYVAAIFLGAIGVGICGILLGFAKDVSFSRF